MSKLSLDRDKIDYAKKLAELCVSPIYHQVERHSSVSVERATLRLLGVKGSGSLSSNTKTPEEGAQYPLVNELVQFLGKEKLKRGAAYWLILAASENPKLDSSNLAKKLISGEISLPSDKNIPNEKLSEVCQNLMSVQVEKLHLKAEEKGKRPPWPRRGKNLRYAVVGTGNVEVDIAQAKQLVEMGVDIIAWRRSSAQSLLDYVPEGKTFQGSAGTLLTQENLALMRQALNELEKKLKRRIGLACSASGLCFPEISLIAALEGVDYLWSDPFHGILFRDINIKRNFIDQAFARKLCSFAGVKLQSGEEEAPYSAQLLSDSWDHVLTMQFLLQAFSKRMGIEESRLIFGHHIDANSKSEDVMLREWSKTQLLRELFPLSRLKLMYFDQKKAKKIGQDSTDIITDDYFRSLLSLSSQIVGDTLESFGSYDRTELNPSIPSYVVRLKMADAFSTLFKSMREEFVFQSHGKASRIARQALDEVIASLKKIQFRGLVKAIEDGVFFNIRRLQNAGLGGDGVFNKLSEYYSPTVHLYNLSKEKRRSPSVPKTKVRAEKLNSHNEKKSSPRREEKPKTNKQQERINKKVEAKSEARVPLKRRQLAADAVESSNKQLEIESSTSKINDENETVKPAEANNLPSSIQVLPEKVAVPEQKSVDVKLEEKKLPEKPEQNRMSERRVLSIKSDKPKEDEKLEDVPVLLLGDPQKAQSISEEGQQKTVVVENSEKPELPNPIVQKDEKNLLEKAKDQKSHAEKKEPREIKNKNSASKNAPKRKSSQNTAIKNKVENKIEKATKAQAVSSQVSGVKPLVRRQLKINKKADDNLDEVKKQSDKTDSQEKLNVIEKSEKDMQQNVAESKEVKIES